MANKRFWLGIPAMALAVVFSFAACNTGASSGGGGGGADKTFWARSVKDDRPYRVYANLLAEGVHCKVYVEIGSGVDEGTAQAMAREYDDNIYRNNNKVFGTDFTIDGKTMNTMEYANYLVGGTDGKLTLLLLNIKDGSAGTSYVAGYFDPRNFLTKSNDPNSNECVMIYVHVRGAGELDSNQTVAHEMQHLMNFVTSVGLREKTMDLWANEGLSLSAEEIYSGDILKDRLGWYILDPTELIRKGNNFFVWDNHQNQGADKYKYDTVLDDYATAYLFFKWLRVQSNGTAIYKDIITSEYGDFRAVTTAAAKHGLSGDWPTLLKTWLAANYFNEPSPSSLYGYKGEITLEGTLGGTPVKAPHYAPGGKTSYDLYPGEAVYSGKPTTPVTLTTDTNIKYADLASTSSVGTDISGGTNYTSSNGSLLTYNVDTSQEGKKAAGSTTGVAASIMPIMNTVSGSRLAALSGPFKISGADMLRRNGHGESPDTLDKITKQLGRRFTKNE
jgi:hypothetical protein